MSNRPSLPPSLYTEDYFRNACEGFDEFNETQGERLSRRLQSAFAVAEVSAGMTVLDVGCGQGFESVTLMAPDRPVVGVDYSADAVAFARERFGAEGLEVSVPARGSVRSVIRDMLKHLCSAISYGGAESLHELQRSFWADPQKYLVRLTAASRAESFQR